MPSITGQEVARGALTILGVYSPSQTLSSSDANICRTFLNDWLSEMAQKASMIPVIARERFDLVANQGGPTNPYTIGPSGDFDTERPPNQNSIVGANLILTATSPEVRVPLDIYTDQEYDANQVPTQTATQPTGIYFNPTYEDDFGSIFLWPVVNTSDNDLELFIQKYLAQFTDLSTSFDVPEGVPRMLKYTLADSLQSVYGRELTPSAQRIAVSSLSTFKRSNAKVSAIANDAAFVSSYRTGLYNIVTDQSR